MNTRKRRRESVVFEIFNSSVLSLVTCMIWVSRHLSIYLSFDNFIQVGFNGNTLFLYTVVSELTRVNPIELGHSVRFIFLVLNSKEASEGSSEVLVVIASLSAEFTISVLGDYIHQIFIFSSQLVIFTPHVLVFHLSYYM
ncbi:hypothetical protein L6452_33295 [Arctium lappa]|uniref:Uncharacterized protein n=1 Tax=Arctium lappa TaxID=4217 RepID=A0ACB8ZBJ0_ARCLA|nr:hypothetical protein L6452_33295 [Arctium lappa]